MAYALDTPSINTLKSEARAMREAASSKGRPLTHAGALEAVARAHGYRDWNTARARLPERVDVPVEVGGRVRGTYLGQAFEGLVLGVQLLTDMQHYQVTVKFDEPVDVVTSKLFSAFRHRVTATVNMRGISPAHTSDGQPHMCVMRA